MASRVAAVIVGLTLLTAACADDGGETAAPADGDAVVDNPVNTTADDPVEDTSTTTTPPPSTATTTSSAGSDETSPSTPTSTDNKAVDDVKLRGPDEQPSAAFLGFRPAEQGDGGDNVLAIQQRLQKFGFAPGTPDGSYGNRTTKSVTAFQGLVGLEETGIADGGTLMALAEYRYDGLLLVAGDEGENVELLQQRLADGPFDPGPVDGAYGTATKQSVWALEKLADIPVDGNWGPLDEQAFTRLTEGEIGGPSQDHEDRWVEVDLSKQIMKVYDPGSTTPTLISHASSGSGIPWENEEYSGSSITPVGQFQIGRRISGWRESSLNIGRLYNPLYFNGGIAFHGAQSVPLYPASHGCIRLPMHVADYLPGELPNGTTVHVLAK